MKNQQLLVMVLVAVIIALAAFFGGVKYQQGRQAKSLAQTRGQFGRSGQGAFRGGRAVTGEVVASDDKTLTIKLVDGSTKIIILSSTTNISRATQGSRDDLKVGTRVSVFGGENNDGSVTAQNILLNPEAVNLGG